jgi:hypothetical protein
MRVPRYTVAVRKADAVHKVCKIWFGSDGSYYVTAPYHPDRSAFLMKCRINYAQSDVLIEFEDAIDRAGLEDDDKALKLSHHPDGFVQFSGSGILSGRGADGTIRGMGLQSWPLTQPVLGPAFGMTIRGLERFPSADSLDPHSVVFDWEKLFPFSDAQSLTVEGFYFMEAWRRFVRVDEDGSPHIRIVHPSKSVIDLRILFPSDKCALGGFIGVEAFVQRKAGHPTPFFSMSGPTGDLRRNLEGELTAESVQCMYPKGDLRVDRTLEYLVPDLSDDPGGRKTQ